MIYFFSTWHVVWFFVTHCTIRCVSRLIWTNTNIQCDSNGHMIQTHACCQSNSFRNRSNHKTMHIAQIQLILNQSHCLLRLDVRTLHILLMTVYLFLFSCQISMQTVFLRLLSLLIQITEPLIIRFFLFCEQHSSRKQSKTSIFAPNIRFF